MTVLDWIIDIIILYTILISLIHQVFTSNFAFYISVPQIGKKMKFEKCYWCMIHLINYTIFILSSILISLIRQVFTNIQIYISGSLLNKNVNFDKCYCYMIHLINDLIIFSTILCYLICKVFTSSIHFVLFLFL